MFNQWVLVTACANLRHYAFFNRNVSFRKKLLFQDHTKLFKRNLQSWPLKGQCHEIFDFRFFHESVSPDPLSNSIPLLSYNFFPKIRGDIRSSRCTTAPSVMDTGGKWKNLQLFFLTPLGSTVELTYRYYFSFKFTFRCQKSDIAPIICHRYP